MTLAEARADLAALEERTRRARALVDRLEQEERRRAASPASAPAARALSALFQPTIVPAGAPSLVELGMRLGAELRARVDARAALSKKR